jgi:iron complex outermembrane recepter protein
MTTPYRLSLLLGLTLTSTIAFAQTTPASSTRSDPADAPVELSPFEVRPEDVGYQAGNTTSGSRLNSRLKDTPASISPFTPEFLSDIGATNLEEMLSYALNIEGEFDDSIAGFSNTPGRAVTGGDFNFRIRGQGAGVSRDFVENGAPNDLYNVERAEVTSGPNSILFGIGSTGGLVSLSGKKAQVSRNKSSLKTVFGSWDYHRVEGDHNQVLIPKVLAVRLLGAYQNALGWRQWDFSDAERGTVAVTYKPFAKTTLHVSGEKGSTSNNASITWNLADSFLRWDAASRPVFDGAASVATGTASIGTADRFTFDERAGIVYNLRNELTTNPLNTDALLSPSLSPYNFNITGPGAKRWQDFSSWQVQFEHRFPKNVTVEAAYFHNDQDHKVAAMNTGNAGLYLRGDPNRTVPNINNTATIPNPRAGQLYVEITPWEDWRYSANDVARLTASWEVNLGKWLGRHRIAGLI